MRSSAILLVALAALSSPVRGIEVGEVTTLGVVISEPSEDVNWNAISLSSADGRLFVSSDDEKIIRVLDMAAETSSQLSGLHEELPDSTRYQDGLGTPELDTAENNEIEDPSLYGTLRGPKGMAYWKEKDALFVADEGAIRIINAADGTVSTISGGIIANGGLPGNLDDCDFCFVDSAVVAEQRWDEAVALAFHGDASGGTLYIHDSGSRGACAIRTLEVTADDSQGGVAGASHTIAGGSGDCGYVNGVGAEAQFGRGRGEIAFNPESRTVYVVDTENQAIRAVAVDTGAVTTLAGQGPENEDDANYQNYAGESARFHFDDEGTGLAFNLCGNIGLRYLYVADGRNNAVRIIDIDTGNVNTLAGLPPVDGNIDEEAYGDYGCGPEYADGPTAECADGIGPTAEFNRPRGVALDHATGLLYVLDKYGQIRSIYVGSTCSVPEDDDDSEGRGDSDEADSDEADSTAAASNDELRGLKTGIVVLGGLTVGMVVIHQSPPIRCPF